jgi:hypothetical protein
MAVRDVLQGGNAKAGLSSSKLGQWSANAPRDKKGKVTHTVPFASTIDEVADDLRQIYTLPRGNWAQGVAVRAQDQYGLPGFPSRGKS